ncbi:MAG: DUF4915 domain-containing protein [Anaerolineae bacterium]
MKPDVLDGLWAHHHAQWRDPMQVISLWEGASEIDRALLAFRTRGAWWDVLERAQITLLVTREYEHLALALGVENGKPAISYLRLPHPSGVAFDAARGIVHIASTRNPNQVIDFKPAVGSLARLDADSADVSGRPLVPVRSRFYPGSLYLHDLALVGGALHANSVGQNAVIRLDDDGSHERVWYPRCIERDGAPVFGQNHIQLNSIAAGDTLETSFFSASTDKISVRRPGHRNFPVDRRGVVFSGATREPMARGLTRPHSARLHDGKIWVDNSGYGTLGYVEDGGLTVVTRLPGWTRGLAFQDGVAFVGTSRVIPRFRQYAPGLDVDKSRCGLSTPSIRAPGEVLGSITWAQGNQIFAVEALPRGFTAGFPFRWQTAA